MDRSPEEVSNRVDELIREIRGFLESTAASWPGGQVIAHAAGEPRDVVCIGHGHILSALALRWVGAPLNMGFRLLIEPAGVAVLGCVPVPVPVLLDIMEPANMNT